MVSVRGIGVAVMTSTSGAGSRPVSRARCDHPEFVLLIDHRKPEVLEGARLRKAAHVSRR